MASVRTAAENDGASPWIEAAYQRFGQAGLAAVRVEAIARELGTTKGSFYWHFSNRAELIAAVMHRWEVDETQRAIEQSQTAGTPHERIAALFSAVAARTSASAGELLLYGEAEAEGVEAIVAAVSQRRIDYLAALLLEVGFSAEEARARSVVSVATVLGSRLLLGVTGLELPSGADLTRTALELVLSPAPNQQPTPQ